MSPIPPPSCDPRAHDEPSIVVPSTESSPADPAELQSEADHPVGGENPEVSDVTESPPPPPLQGSEEEGKVGPDQPESSPPSPAGVPDTSSTPARGDDLGLDSEPTIDFDLLEETDRRWHEAEARAGAAEERVANLVLDLRDWKDAHRELELERKAWVRLLDRIEVPDAPEGEGIGWRRGQLEARWDLLATTGVPPCSTR